MSNLEKIAKIAAAAAEPGLSIAVLSRDAPAIVDAALALLREQRPDCAAARSLRAVVPGASITGNAADCILVDGDTADLLPEVVDSVVKTRLKPDGVTIYVPPIDGDASAEATYGDPDERGGL